MATDTPQNAPPQAASANSAGTQIDERLGELNSLLENWQQVGAKKQAKLSPADQTFENCLVQVRLGMASSLFMALRCKHAPTASHSLRVALGCSAWATALEISKEEREAIEVAALLHDVGKIGVPDRVLLKPGALASEEAVLMDRYRRMTVEILTACCASSLVLSLVTNAPAWYDGSRPISNLSGEKIPLGSRLIAIMDAFDAMTSAQIYRPAFSHERAVKELFAFAGTQFDPRLVQCFSELHERDLEHLHRRTAGKWLQDLDAASTDSCWELSNSFAGRTPLVTETLFQQKLLDNMYDGVVFLDNNLQITLWNNGAERLTGIDGAAVYQRSFKPSLFRLSDEHGAAVQRRQLPDRPRPAHRKSIFDAAQVRGRNDDDVVVDAHIMPVVGSDGTIQGVTLVLHDASPETSLEERCQRLHEKAIRDPLTQVANRAEFDRVHGIFVETHLQRGLPCSLIICDIDHFKRVNDNYGHPAGDEVIKSFAQLLKSKCRSGDLVARYGGEEFVMLCADCGVATAFERTERIRRAFAELRPTRARRPPGQREFWRHGNPARRFGPDDAQSGRSRAVVSQAVRPQHGRAARRRGRRAEGGSPLVAILAVERDRCGARAKHGHGRAAQGGDRKAPRVRRRSQGRNQVDRTQSDPPVHLRRSFAKGPSQQRSANPARRRSEFLRRARPAD